MIKQQITPEELTVRSFLKPSSNRPHRSCPPDLGLTLASLHLAPAPLHLSVSPPYAQATVDRALAQRLKGNEFFKAGELQNALREYHSVLLHLKGQCQRVDFGQEVARD
jgi:hypothetical protein